MSALSLLYQHFVCLTFSKSYLQYLSLAKQAEKIKKANKARAEVDAFSCEPMTLLHTGTSRAHLSCVALLYFVLLSLQGGFVS